MSNIGFMENCTIHIEAFFKVCMENKVNPSKTDKESYQKLLYDLDYMYRHDEIEDKKKYKELLKRLKESDLTRVTELRNKYNKKKAMGGG